MKKAALLPSDQARAASVLAKGELKAALNLTVAGASKTAVEAIEKAGGKITLTRPVKEEAAAE